jgi:hypothetical protein
MTNEERRAKRKAVQQEYDKAISAAHKKFDLADDERLCALENAWKKHGAAKRKRDDAIRDADEKFLIAAKKMKREHDDADAKCLIAGKKMERACEAAWKKRKAALAKLMNPKALVALRRACKAAGETR